jgi:hypothetical protein
MSGFAEDGTFRPTNPLTREAAVSVVMEAARRILSAHAWRVCPSRFIVPPSRMWRRIAGAR